MDRRAGAARVTITPPIGSAMIGFAGRGRSDGLHDDLTATALVLEAPEAQTGRMTRLAIIACDLLWLETETIEAVCEAASRLADVPADNVVVTCSHTHYGPATDPSRDEGPQIRPYLANLVHLLAGAVALARESAAPCRMGVGYGEAHIGVNRRERTADGRIILGQNPAGPCDRRVAVLRIDGVDGRPIATLLNFACHPVSLAGRCTHISADFPGVARHLVEEHTGSLCLFVQGAAANINPLLMGWDWTHPVRLGLPLGAEAVRVYGSITPGEDDAGGIGVARSRIQLPPLLPSSVEEGRAAVAALEADQSRLRDSGEAGALWWVQRRLDRAEKGLAALQGGEAVPPIPAELAAVRLGRELGLMTAPGEIFTEIGQSIVARSPFRHTLYAAYTDGSIWYVPTRAAYPEGGYEVTHACLVAPEAGELLEEESVRLLHQAHAGS